MHLPIGRDVCRKVGTIKTTIVGTFVIRSTVHTVKWNAETKKKKLGLMGTNGVLNGRTKKVDKKHFMIWVLQKQCSGSYPIPASLSSITSVLSCTAAIAN